MSTDYLILKERALARVSKDTARAAPRARPWFETPRKSAAPHHEGLKSQNLGEEGTNAAAGAVAGAAAGRGAFADFAACAPAENPVSASR
jgi:hypothetical protein